MGQFVPKSPCGGWTDSRRFLLEGGVLTATTYIRPYKVVAGKGSVQTMEERFDYGLNPKKREPCPHTSVIRPRLPLSFCW